MDKHISCDESQLVNHIIAELKQQNLINSTQNVTIIYNSVNDDLLYTVSEVAEKLKVNHNKVYSLINAGLLPSLNFGRAKVRRVTLLEFLEKYEGVDLSFI